jgi:hypothetical protein
MLDVPARMASILMPFPPDTGAAVVAVGGTLLIVFDRPGQISLEELRNLAAGLAAAETQVSGSTTQLRVPLAVAESVGIQLLGGPGGWHLGTAEAVPPAAAVPAMSLEWPPRSTRTLLLRAGDIGRVISVRNPAAEGTLLIGTVSAGSQARLLAPLPDQPGIELLPTRLGIAMRPLSAEVSLRPVAEGFEVTMARGEERGLGAPPALDPRRLLDLADVPRADLLKRRQLAQAATAAAEPAKRGGGRLVLGEALLGMGMGHEALSLIQLAMAESIDLARLPRAILLAGAAALVAGRDAEAANYLADVRLNGEPEARLWRALASTQRGVALPVETQSALTDELALLRGYPVALRARLAPAAAEALAAGGRADAAAELLDDLRIVTLPRVGLARARVNEARGEKGAAMREYGSLVRSRDHFVRAAALSRGAELELASGRIDARRAAAQTEAAAMAWRGDGRELARRLRAVELYTNANMPAFALGLLEQTLGLFPDNAPRLRANLEVVFPAALADPALPLGEANRLAFRMMENLPPSQESTAALVHVADRLAATELPVQAAELLRLGVARTADPVLRASLSLRLARAALAADDAAGALEALGGAPLPALPAAARDDRLHLEAEARRRRGDLAGAADLLRGLGQAGLRQLVEVLAAMEDWRGAAEALGAQVRQTVPAAPAPLDTAQRRSLVRLAAFVSLAGDEAGIEALRTQYASRMAGGPLAEAFLATLGVDALPRRGGAAPNLGTLRRDLATARRLQEQLIDLR